ncbi:hypothetical protein SGFS_069870 [Streptomyces graminofaciens]|uniref:Uncharacterized protein n=1 Tax=Streptomyces graminofaciens TaxID=68212 RepID=A0ABN5VQE7_9ACTN|nr:hypothetical protein SGFS_069870 [Streptomyces graminofaciens]
MPFQLAAASASPEAPRPSAATTAATPADFAIRPMFMLNPVSSQVTSVANHHSNVPVISWAHIVQKGGHRPRTGQSDGTGALGASRLEAGRRL